MKRKNFIEVIVPAAFALQSWRTLDSGQTKKGMPEVESVKPRYLSQGDTIGITCPAGFITVEEIQPAVAKLIEWDFNVKIGETVGKRNATFGGTDEERLADLQQMIDDKKISAILFGRGGYGAVRIVDKINFKKFIAHPKWILGFSDITTLHSHINKNFSIATIHSKMCNSFPADWSLADQLQIETIDSIRKCLLGEKMEYSFLPNSNNKVGNATGILVGGNLKTIESLAGSKSDLNTAGKILFVEDIGEQLYSIDRMFWNLKRSGKLDKLAALIVGGFKIKKEETEAEIFGETLEEIVLSKLKNYTYPVCFDFPVGHQKNNFALKCGVKHQLKLSNESCLLKEIL